LLLGGSGGRDQRLPANRRQASGPQVRPCRAAGPLLVTQLGGHPLQRREVLALTLASPELVKRAAGPVRLACDLPRANSTLTVASLANWIEAGGVQSDCTRQPNKRPIQHKIGTGCMAGYESDHEAPAIVEVLLDGATATGFGRIVRAMWWLPSPTYAAVQATLLDLGARDYLRLAVDESGGLTCRGVGPAAATGLAPFEHHVLQHAVGRLARGTVPAAALLPDTEGEDGRRWYSAFGDGVIDQARRLGLIRLRAPLLYRVTPAGRDFTQRWLRIRDRLATGRSARPLAVGAAVDDRMLAWAVVLHAADNVVAAMPRPEKGRVWSPGRDGWRKVLVSERVRRPLQRPPDVIAKDRRFAGHVVRRWIVSTGSYDAPDPHYYLAIDDHQSDVAFTWTVRADQYKRLPTGSIVFVAAVGVGGRLIGLRTRFEEYVGWYSWARRDLTADAIAAHAVATAATDALAAGHDWATAAAAAGRAADDNATLDRMRATYGTNHRYVEWFLWTRDRLSLPDEWCHETAAVAVRTLEAGGTNRDAVAAMLGRLPKWMIIPESLRSESERHQS
jgi:hypothetical protein